MRVAKRCRFHSRGSPPGTGRSVQISFVLSAETQHGSEFHFGHRLARVVSQVPPPGVGGRRAEERGERGGTTERERSEPPLISAKRSLLKQSKDRSEARRVG